MIGMAIHPNLLLALHGATEADPAHPGITRVVQIAAALLGIASAVGVLTKIVRIPYTVALVLAGLGLALLGTPVSRVHMTQELVLTLFLPPLLFQAGLNLDLEQLRRHAVPVALLAIPGVVLTMAAAALAIRWILPHAVGADRATWTAALVIGAVIAPTDPVSVIGIFRTLGVPERLRVLIEGESLFNDGTAAALFSVLNGAVAAAALAGETGGSVAAPGPGEVAVVFLRVAGIGTVLGLGLGVVVFWVLKNLNDQTLETGITVALAWGSFVLAESLHVSGVLAVIAAGLLVGNYGKTLAMAETTRVTLTGFWDSLDFIVNSLVFLLVGLELGDPAVGGVRHLRDPVVLLGAAAVFGALLIARFLKVAIVYRLTPGRWPRPWNWVIWWAGLRGGLCLALVLGMPDGELRSYAVGVVFLVVLATLLLQGTTMSRVIRWARIDSEEHIRGVEPAPDA